MSIVNSWLPGARVLDLFAGSGALGLEALSRGAESVDFVEIAPKSLAAIATNAERLSAAGQITLHRTDALRFIERVEPHAYDVAFADPPYGIGLAERLADTWREKPFAGIFGVEHAAQERIAAGDTRTTSSFKRQKGRLPCFTNRSSPEPAWPCWRSLPHPQRLKHQETQP